MNRDRRHELPSVNVVGHDPHPDLAPARKEFEARAAAATAEADRNRNAGLALIQAIGEHGQDVPIEALVAKLAKKHGDAVRWIPDALKAAGLPAAGGDVRERRKQAVNVVVVKRGDELRTEADRQQRRARACQRGDVLVFNDDLQDPAGWHGLFESLLLKQQDRVTRARPPLPVTENPLYAAPSPKPPARERVKGPGERLDDIEFRLARIERRLGLSPASTPPAAKSEAREGPPAHEP